MQPCFPSSSISLSVVLAPPHKMKQHGKEHMGHPRIIQQSSTSLVLVRTSSVEDCAATRAQGTAAPPRLVRSEQTLGPNSNSE